MATLSLQRCLQHPEREAVARCPECARFFCRECITEHDDRVICASCLAKIHGNAVRKNSMWRIPFRAAAVLTGLLVAISIYHSFGSILVKIPSSFHEGTVWKRSWLDTEKEEPEKKAEP